jgi:thioredoxin 1
MDTITVCVKNVNDDSFVDVLDYSKKHSDDLVVVDFWADWCQPCKMISPIFHKIAESYSEKNNKVKFYKADANESGNSMQNYSIRSIPTLLFLKAGEKVDSMVGMLAESAIVKQIESCLNS